ncbi:SH3 domain-containing protein [Mesorhizobium sp. B2-3-4]|uniref:SH3 domain-containing protein n=1 Tax=Mesorhizobium sp. B2-3-4 TaxID=2589959 RepID=UPI001FEFF395|nr:SH3 domain-containing protein [Mesorhizobium sp. B2-3-4]
MKRRTVTLHRNLHALIAAAPLLMAAWPAVVPAHAEEAPFISIVTGLAPDDLLNVRAKPSPLGKTETRLAAGASVRNLGCNEIEGHPWCKVESDNPKANGWAPARYLVPVNPATVPVDQAGEAPAVAMAADTSQKSDAATPAAGAAPVAGATPAAEAASPVVQPPPAPPDLTARLGGVSHPAASAEPPVKSAAATAMQDAYGLALAAQDNPTTSEIKSPIEAPAPAPVAAATVTPAPAEAVAVASAPEAPVGKADQQPVQEAAAEPADDAGPAAGEAPAQQAKGIPVPTPRPGKRAEEPAIDPQTVARVEPPQPLAHAPDATGEIPCARYVGQPMTRCEISVVRNGSDKADVTVTWPDGGTRVISFYAGQPAGSNSRSDFRFTREGNLNMIRVGVSERFEITDQLALGD